MMGDTQEVSLIIDGQVFNVRKDVLCEHSDYFSAMFSGHYVEKEQQEIFIDVVDANSMNIILRYMDLGLIDLSEYSLPTVGDLAVAANFLQITELTKQIDYCLEQQLTLTNWIEIKDIAQNASSAKLEQAAVIYGLFSFKLMKPELIPTIHKLFWYLSHPYLNTESEIKVFRFGLQWIEKEEMGADALLIILCCLDISRVTSAELKDMKAMIKHYENSLTEKVIDCLYKLSVEYELSPVEIIKNKLVLCELYTEKVYSEVLNLVKESIQRKLRLTSAVPMWSNKDAKPEISPSYMYTFTEELGFQQWLEVAEKNLWGWNVASWSPTKIVVVCGEYGRGTGFFMKDVKVYDIHKKEWIRHGVELPVRRHGGVAVVEDSLFIVGGVGGFRFGYLQSLAVCSNFRYLGSLIENNGDVDRDVKNRINAEWMKWRQVSHKDYLYSGCYSNLRNILVIIPKQGSLTSVTGDHQVEYLNKSPAYWAAEKRRVNIGRSKHMSSEPMEPTPKAVHYFQGIDMRPKVKPKEKPELPEIPEPGSPELPLPGFPVPGFPDVAVPIVPEFPLPEIPEIPLPRSPPKAPTRLPGKPTPIFPEFILRRKPAAVIPEDYIPDLFPLVLYDQSEPSKVVGNIINNNNALQALLKIKPNPGGMLIPVMIPVVLDSAIIYDLKHRTFRKIAKLPDAIQSPAVCAHENVVYAAGHKNIYKYEDYGQHDRWSTVLVTDMRPNCLVSFKGYIYVTQGYFTNLYRFRPDLDTELEQISCFSNPPLAVCSLGNRLLAFTSSGNASSDISAVEEYREVYPQDKNPKVLWSQIGSEFGVNGVAGSCSVILTIPPVNPALSAYHKRYLTMYG